MSDLQNLPAAAATHLKRKTNVILQLPSKTPHKHCPHCTLHSQHISTGGPGSSVGIATGYGLDGPRIESR